MLSSDLTAQLSSKLLRLEPLRCWLALPCKTSVPGIAPETRHNRAGTALSGSVFTGQNSRGEGKRRSFLPARDEKAAARTRALTNWPDEKDSLHERCKQLLVSKRSLFPRRLPVCEPCEERACCFGLLGSITCCALCLSRTEQRR